MLWSTFRFVSRGQRAASPAGPGSIINPPLTIREQRALLAHLQPSGKRVMAERREFWNATLCRAHLSFMLAVYRR